jgi:hypothetical protein
MSDQMVNPFERRSVRQRCCIDGLECPGEFSGIPRGQGSQA